MTAGDSPLQQQAFQGIGSLAVPGAVGQAATGAGQVAGQLQGLGSAGYNPMQFSTQMWNAQQAPQYGQMPAAGGKPNMGLPNSLNPNVPTTNPVGGMPGDGSMSPTGDSMLTRGRMGMVGVPIGAGTGAPTPSNPSLTAPSTGSGNLVEQYMNPYLQNSLKPQLDESRRQADISRLNDSARLTQAGAYGGSRQAIMESEGRRNLMDIQGQITGRGYDTAYTQAMGQFNADQGRALDAQKATEASRQFGAGYGLDALGKAADTYKTQSQLGLAGFDAQRQGLQDQLAAGKQQQATEQAGLDAEYALWAQAQQHPYTALEFQKSMLSGIPTVIDQRNKLDDIGRLAQILGGAKEIGDTGLFDWLKTQLPDMGEYFTSGT